MSKRSKIIISDGKRSTLVETRTGIMNMIVTDHEYILKSISDTASLEVIARMHSLEPTNDEDVDWDGTTIHVTGPIYALPGWCGDDGNCEVEYSDANSAQAAAELYVSEGDWGDDESETSWVTVYCWQVVVGIGSNGEVISASLVFFFTLFTLGAFGLCSFNVPKDNTSESGFNHLIFSGIEDCI